MASQDELLAIVRRFEAFVERAEDERVRTPLDRVQEAAGQVGESWSGSWLGYQANVYYRDLKPPPPGAHFSTEWGLRPSVFGQGTSGEWREYRPEEVEAAISEVAGNADLSAARFLREEIADAIEEEKLQVLSIVESSGLADWLLTRLTENIDDLGVTTPAKVVKTLRPSGSFVLHDTLAANQGTWVPPHVSVLAEVFAARIDLGVADKFLRLTRQARRHLVRVQGRTERGAGGRTVFVGHGRSSVWRELKAFLEERIGLTVEEFNNVSVAGVPTAERLAEMLDAATFAFLVMTGEDEQPDGTVNARLNVVHEVGLFQGRLGFARAIVLLEEGCEEFSNIAGLGQIRFPPGNLASKFEDVRRVLEREGVVADA